MPRSPQAKFSKRVRIEMVKRDLSVTDLAKLVGRRRDTVSTAIHSDRFPVVKRQIEEALK
ncbi:MAG TPA: hypothetical protein VK961_00030 [Chthoniobacter sp.]|nr:hypothetical protein [Chthoniobacter sp.]